MTLVLTTAAGALTSVQFGLNELASAITVGRYIGSIISRQQDEKIVEVVSELNQLQLQELPDWLTTVKFTRGATVYGERMRKLAAHNVMDDVDIATVGGLVTFIALVLRYVQTPEDTADKIMDLLRGRYDVLLGPAGSSSSEYTAPSVPYSTKLSLVKFVKLVWESDKDSSQNADCLQWLSELTLCVGKSPDPNSHTSHSLSEQQRFWKCLMAAKKSGQPTACTFDTLSAGVAMIALAAHAQGANVQLECVIPAVREGEMDHEIEIKQIPQVRSKPGGIVVKLWLMRPPLEMRVEIPGLDSCTRPLNERATPALTVYGGAAEISKFVANQIGASLKADQSLKLWEEGLKIGEQAIWAPWPNPTSLRRQALNGVLSSRTTAASLSKRLVLARNFWDANLEEAMTTRKRFSIKVSQYKFEPSLLDKALMAIHRTFKQVNYKDNKSVQKSIELALIAITVGCIKSQIDDHSHGQELKSFAWTFDVRGRNVGELLGAFNGWLRDGEWVIKPGVTISSLLRLAGSIWGGFLSNQSLAPLTDDNTDTLGLVCPHGTFILDILRDPEGFINEASQSGWRPLKPIVSFYKGSMPLLPQVLTNGLVLGGDSLASMTRRDLASVYTKSSHERSSDLEIPPPIVTLEIMATNTTHLSAVFCAWSFGDVVAEINPAMVFHNMLYQGSVDTLREYTPNAVAARWRHWRHRSTTEEVSCERLINLGFFKASWNVHIVRVGPQWEWRFLVAGLADQSFIIDARGADLGSLERTLSYLSPEDIPTPIILLLERGGETSRGNST